MDKDIFVHFIMFKSDNAWRNLPESEKTKGRKEFVDAARSFKGIIIHSYSTIGTKVGTDFFLWHIGHSVESLQEMASSLLKTGLGRHLEITNSLLGMVGSSVYVKKQDSQQQAIDAEDRKKYLIVYPFTKTPEWYMLGKEDRQNMMNEHIVVGKGFPSVRQVLAYSFGLDDYEFVISYETDSLKDFQDLLRAMRETKVRLYTLKDTPIFLGVHRTLKKTLELLG